MESRTEPISAFAVYSMKRKNVDNLPKLKRLQSKRKNSLYKEKKSKSIKPTVPESSISPVARKKKLKQSIKSSKSITKVVKNPQEFKVTINKPEVNKVTKHDKVKKIEKLRKTEKVTNVKKCVNMEVTKPEKSEKVKKLKRTEKLENNCLDNQTSQQQSSSCDLKESIKRFKKSKKKFYPKQIAIFNEEIISDPLDESRRCFEWLISPFQVDEFFENSWEKQPVQIKRNDQTYYNFLMSTPMFDSILRENHVLYTKNIDVTSYSDGVRETHNQEGRALPSTVWDFYNNSCSIRMLNPQTFIPQLHNLNAILQEFFGCFVGANSYLTPPNSQGFAPHYDDIEAFIIQIEGKKRWRLYKPRNEDYLARFSSKNFDESEIGDPFMDTVLNAGDLLYFPRGTIHQGETIDNTHSLHITLSVYQKNSWADFLEKLLPKTLERASKLDYRFREGLPVGYLRHLGLVHSDDESTDRKAFLGKAKFLLQKVINYVDIDEAADEMAKGHIHDFLPPIFNGQELECSTLQDGWIVRNQGVVEEPVFIQPETRIRLARSHCVRLVEEGSTIRVYYSTDNSKEYHEYDPLFLEIDHSQVPLIKTIILQYPNYVKVEDLPPFDIDIDTKVLIVKELWEKCIIVTDGPLPRVD